ncbi:MAG: hypothetical protein OXS47_13495 [Chloroflexota bacterium]|nr:hypothetical protein [Chloroflexota bacterium]
MGRSRLLVTFDMDGVLCRNPLGINPGGVSSDATSPPRLPRPTWPIERWLYFRRKPMPGAVEGFHAIAERFECAVVSARGEGSRPLTEDWLAHTFGVSPPVRLRSSWRERSSAFKARVIPPLKPLAHFEDDPNTALLLAERIPHVFLVDWPRNHGVERENIHRIERITDALPILEAVAGDSGVPGS